MLPVENAPGTRLECNTSQRCITPSNYLYISVHSEGCETENIEELPDDSLQFLRKSFVLTHGNLD